jgi:S1-C subfamily serine protease
MKFSSIVLVGAAVFVGVLGALQLNERVLSKKNSALPLITERDSLTPAELIPVQNSPGSVDFREAAKRVQPSVVSVDRFNRFRRGFFDESGVEAETGSGSGVVLSADGVIVTNNHVVEGAQRVRVRLSDGRSMEAQVVGTDPRSDIAVLRVRAQNLRPIQTAKSSEVQVGQWVMAVGNPLGFDNTVSVGVVSSLKRSLPIGPLGLVDAIQTDAAINPGNSGGALTDAQGRLIGINSAIASGTGQSVGIGFSVPIDRVKRVVDDILRFGEARYATLGVQYAPWPQAARSMRFREIVEPMRQYENVPEQGVLVAETSRGAEAAGIRPGAIIIKVNDTEITSTFDLIRFLTPKRDGDTVNVTYWKDGRVSEARVRLQTPAAARI